MEYFVAGWVNETHNLCVLEVVFFRTEGDGHFSAVQQANIWKYKKHQTQFLTVGLQDYNKKSLVLSFTCFW